VFYLNSLLSNKNPHPKALIIATRDSNFKNGTHLDKRTGKVEMIDIMLRDQMEEGEGE
jgi:hypothetical protein